jgi:two-component system response regulator AtoC
MMLNGRQILVLEDEVLLRKSLCAYLEKKGALAYPAESISEAKELMGSTELDFALIDIKLPDGNSLGLFDDPGFSENTRVVVMTADGGVRTAVEAIRKGASDYLSKPFDAEELPMVFSRVSRESARSRIDQFKRGARSDPDDSLFMGQRMQVVHQQIERILQVEARLEGSLPPILIEGETGTGKSSIARWIHEHGPRKDAPLIEVNCSTLPESLAESELFGHERGAFTDARKERIGLFEAADGGSLFLDEVASLPLTLQAKVLTAIEDGHIRRVGGNSRKTVDVRLITASLHPLSELVHEGSFREDLFHRLNLLHIQIPALRNFPSDLPKLAERILEGLKKRYRQTGCSISPEAMRQLTRYPWPGNVRELIHELERALIFADGEALAFDHLSPGSQADHGEQSTNSLLNPNFTIPGDGFRFEDELKHLSDAVIAEAMRQEKDNVSAAARRLGVSRDFIRYRLQE